MIFPRSAHGVLALALLMACKSGGTDPCELPGAICECVADADCGPFATCEATDTGRACSCLPGYAGDPCAWSVLLKDPGFSETPSPWKASKGAVIEPTATGGVDPGQATFPRAALCAFGTVQQTVTMPALESTEPLIVRASLRVRQETATTHSPDFAFAANDSWTSGRVPMGNAAFASQEYCLGEAAYGGDVELTLSSDRYFGDCPSTDALLEVDRFEVTGASAGQCPLPGEALNGDFESEGGWTLVSQPGTSAEIVDGVGAGATRGGRLSVSSRCDTASLTGQFSVPSVESMPSPAIRFWWNASIGSQVHLWLDGDKPWDRLDGSGSDLESLYCLPPWAAGSVHSMLVQMHGSGACSDTLDWEFAIDNVALVDEPACGTTTGLLDPGFESAPIPHVGNRVIDVPGLTTLYDAARAHTGNGVLRLSRSQGCFESRQELYVIPPAPSGGAGPALRFWYKMPGNPNTTASVVTDADEGLLEENGDWTQGRVCLDPQRVGRPTKVIFRLFGGGRPCANFEASEFAFFDDLELTTDASCPQN